MEQLHFECLPLTLPSFLLLVLLVCLHEGGEDAVLLVQQGLGSVVLQDDPPLHHNHQVGIQDGVDAMLCGGGEENQSAPRALAQDHREQLSSVTNSDRQAWNDEKFIVTCTCNKIGCCVRVPGDIIIIMYIHD